MLFAAVLWRVEHGARLIYSVPVCKAHFLREGFAFQNFGVSVQCWRMLSESPGCSK